MTEAMWMSMTGYGTASGTFKTKQGSLELHVEMRTVNSKYLDIHLRLPRHFVAQEAQVQKWIKSRLKRGRVDLQVQARMISGASREIVVNFPQVQELHKAYQSVMKRLNLRGEVQLSDLLVHPEWIDLKEPVEATKEEWAALSRGLDRALKQVLAARQREGKAIRDDIMEHVEVYARSFKSIRDQHDDLVDRLRKRTRERFMSLLGDASFDRQRLEHEISIWIARSDFREEIDRIDHHLESLRTWLKTKKEVGRQVEFVIQELQRETNTLGSKCADAQLTPVIVHLKTQIERIREQIQNVE